MVGSVHPSAVEELPAATEEEGVLGGCLGLYIAVIDLVALMAAERPGGL